MYRHPEVSAQSPDVSRKVLQGCPALREALERRPEVQMAQPDYLEPREGWRAEATRVGLTQEEIDRLDVELPMPAVIRVLTGFPPRALLRLDPR